jgi:hypothetical protein
MSSYRVLCDMSPNWNRAPINRFSQARAKKLLIKFNSYCPGKHSIEVIEE